MHRLEIMREGVAYYCENAEESEGPSADARFHAFGKSNWNLEETVTHLDVAIPIPMSFGIQFHFHPSSSWRKSNGRSQTLPHSLTHK